MELKDWTMEYVRARDAIKKTIISHTIQGDEITYTHKHKKHHFLVTEELVVPEAKDWYTIVCLNNKKNVTFLIQHWKELQQKNLFILFVNTKINAHWQINPKIHNMIADPETLEEGIQAMYNEVLPV